MIGLALVVTIMTWVNPLVASVFGADLLLMPALSLVLVTVAQMFIVGGSEIDLGVGAFAGLVSVLAATLLYDRPLTGAAAIVAVLLAYTLLGGLIQARRIPAIVVTLGASFIWVGLGYALQPTPGGASPEWLSALVGWSVSDLPTSILLIVAVALIARAIDWSPIGVALRGFGNNAAAMRRSGWSPTRYALVRYLIAGLFAAAAGLSLTAINTASDINSGNSYTLLSVAAVVMGGCTLIGGIISPFGAVVGAVTLGAHRCAARHARRQQRLQPGDSGSGADRALGAAQRRRRAQRGGMTVAGLFDFTRRNRWVWAAAAVVLLWLMLSFATSRFSLSSLSGILLSASFLTLVALGQMFVVATGRGNIDLSIASVITLNAYLALITVGGADAGLLLGLPAAAGVGFLVGGFNALLVVAVRIPAIIATWPPATCSPPPPLLPIGRSPALRSARHSNG